MQRLIANWVYGGFLAGLMLLALLPLVAGGLSTAMLLVVLNLPVYMIHQYEEHDADRFRRFVNTRLGGGRDVLPVAAVFVINIGGVWMLNVATIWLAALGGVGWGLIAIYATLVNAIAHIGASLALRCYNPGVVTSVLLFLPLAGAALWAIQASGEATLQQHEVSLAAALLLHAAIIGTVRLNTRRLG